ncbi:MAG: hypothetical protein WCO51_02515, partial [bacterium]
MLVAAAGLVMVIGMGSAPTAQTAYDLLKEWPKAKVENQMGEAVVRQITSGGVKLNSISLCPSKQRATATYELILPRGNVDERLALTFQVGLDDNLTQEDKQIQSDGVRFFVDINGLTVFTSDNTSPGWVPCSIDLTEYAGQTIRLVFSTDSKANTNFDWASIAVPRITRLGGTTSSITKMTKGILEVRSTKAETVTLEMDGPNGRTVSKVSLPITPSSSFYYPVDGLQGKYDFVKVVGSTSAKLFYYPFKPQMKLSSVTASKGLVTLGETFEVRAIVRNDGEGVYEGGKSRLGLGNASGLHVLERGEQPIGSLLPGQTAVYKWAAKATSIQNPNNILVKMLGEQMDAMVGIIPVAPPPPTITKQGLAAVAYNSTAYIQNETMRLVFQRSSEGSAARIFAKTASGWTQVAVWSPLTLILGNGSGAPTRTYTLRLNHTSASVYGTTAAVRLRGETSDLWAMEVECRLQKGSRAAQLIAHIKPRVGADIKAICFPDIKVADSPLGVKEAALFPGLEYLFQDEASGKPSEGNLLGTPWSPHIYKITAPLMAVRLRSALVALNWEPLQDWATGYNGLSTQFSSPNSLENEDNHKMALWVPSVRDVADEDTFPAQRPFYLGAGTPITITANLVVLPNSSSLLDIVDWYVSAKGLPSLPSPSHSGINAIDFLTQGLLNSYDPDQKAWRHTNTGPVSFDPLVALPILMQSRITNNSDLRLRALDQIKESVEKVGIGSTGVLAFHLGDIEKALAAMRKDVEGLIRSQKADGSWAWTPPTELHKVLGRTGDTSSGYSGANAAIVWEYARITGDSAAMEAGRKALRFLDTLSRPEGAQTWELPLHVP